MDVTYLDLAQSAGLAIALAACAGLRAMVPLLLTGLCLRAGWVDVGPSFAFLGTDRALILFGLATVLEIAGDKIPAVDHALDVVHSFLRPLSGSILAAAALSSVSEPTTSLVLGIVLGAPTALVPHVARSSARWVSTIFTAGFANPLLSIAEDVLAVILFVLAVLLPILAALVVLLVLFLILWRLSARRPPSAAPATASVAAAAR